MRGKTLIFVPIALAFAALPLNAQAASKEVQRVPISQTNAASGKDMFVHYCATCHGLDGKGNGPAASALKTAPPNLTTLSKTHAGKFPTMSVMNSITGDSNRPAAHGAKDMPVWGQLFSGMGHGSNAEAALRISNLTHYVETLQEK